MRAERIHPTRIMLSNGHKAIIKSSPSGIRALFESIGRTRRSVRLDSLEEWVLLPPVGGGRRSLLGRLGGLGADCRRLRHACGKFSCVCRPPQIMRSTRSMEPPSHFPFRNVIRFKKTVSHYPYPLA